jgi:hypothetical protein
MPRVRARNKPVISGLYLFQAISCVTAISGLSVVSSYSPLRDSFIKHRSRYPCSPI